MIVEGARMERRVAKQGIPGRTQIYVAGDSSYCAQTLTAIGFDQTRWAVAPSEILLAQNGFSPAIFLKGQWNILFGHIPMAVRVCAQEPSVASNIDLGSTRNALFGPHAFTPRANANWDPYPWG